MSKNVISVLHKNGEVEACFINDMEFAERFCNGLNKILKEDNWSLYEVSEIATEGELTDGYDMLSLILENEKVIKVYINDSGKAQEDFDRLPKNEDFKYTLILDMEEYKGKTEVE